MKQYICLNHGECNWADETPPREFSLPDGDDHACPNCESTNIKEKPQPPGPPWLKVAGILGVILLIVALILAFWPGPPPPPKHVLTLKATPNCQKGTITLTTNGGDGSPVVFGAEGLKSTGDSSVFNMPKDRRNGRTLTFYAVQNGERVDMKYRTNCPTPEPVPPIHVGGRSTKSVQWTRVLGSEFCVSNCVQTYNETDNLGHIRQRKVKNCADCQMDEK